MRKIVLTGLLFLSLSFISNAQNLIVNGSFESTGSTNGNMWFDFCDNEITYLQNNNSATCFVNFSSSVPLAGSNNTNSLHASVGPPGDWGARTFIPAQTGTFVYQLNYWMKSEPDLNGNPSGGVAIIGIYNDHTYTISKSNSASNASWTQYSIIDTITTAIDDTLYVELHAPGPDFFQQQDLFDLVELSIIDTISSVGIKIVNQEQTKIFPVPAEEYINIELTQKVTGDILVNVYDLMGKCIKTIETNASTIKVNRENLPQVFILLKL